MILDAERNIRYEPIYTPADISRYAHVPSATLRTWTGSGGRRQVLRPAGSGVAPFSFINLIEAHVLAALRKRHDVPMQRVRKAIRWMREHFGKRHPLAEVDIEAFGREIFVDHMGMKVAATAGGQSVIPEIMRLYLQRVERDAAGPVRFYPLTTWQGCPKRIVMDPCVEFGRPVISGTRIETVMLFDRYSGGESLGDLAADYGLDLTAVEEALRCEIERRAA